MKKLLLILSACGLCCLIAAGQTNCGPDSSSLFSFHNVKLRSLTTGTEGTLDSAGAAAQRLLKSKEMPASNLALNAAAASGEALAARLSSDGFRFESERRMYRELDEAGYLTRQVAEPEKSFDYYFGRIFEPEVYRMGKTKVSCSLLTAIKRKNPFCLINPLFFQMTW